MEASSSNPPNMIFDIFISFRGEVRNTLVGYLYKALCKLGMTPFMDDKKLLVGDRLSEKLAKAIEESRTSIVVLSEDYASSKWCLRELVKIVDCMDDGSNRIIPVFYHVDPSDVRKQSASFEKSFHVHENILRDIESKKKEKYSKEEVKQWKDALTKIGNLCGVVVTKDRPEVNDLDKITNQIFDMLRKTKLIVPDRLKNLFDMPDRLRLMNKLLDFGSNEVRFIGIVGMGGIGKTTIAEVCYETIASKFENNCCFLSIHGCNLVSVQRQLLSRLLQKEDIEILVESEGANMIKNCLRDRKVLIVLDGVDETTQLRNLAGSYDWFGLQSRIIITTRNRDVLRQANYKKVLVYDVELLDYESSFSLFCKHAFGDGGSDHQNFTTLSEEIVRKVKGHPQALEEIGSFLFGQSIDVWREELESLTSVENKRLFKILKISFDKLERESQQAFLDLTCFFNGKSKGKVVEILKSLDYKPHSELQLLCDRSLIEIKCEDTIFIPNFIQAMGQQIEREAPQRSRIWLQEDAFDIFAEQHGVRHIKGIVLDMNKQQHELVLEPILFENMTSLKILEIHNVNLQGNLEYLSNQLRSLHWHRYPSRSLPPDFQSPHLLELLLPVGQTTRLWNGSKSFEKLKVIDASDSHNLVETPKFYGVLNLERLILRNCTRLQKIDDSISTLNHLVLLDLTCCFRLKTFPSLRRLRSFTNLKLSGSGLEGLNRLEGAEQPQSRSLFPHVRQMFRRFRE